MRPWEMQDFRASEITDMYQHIRNQQQAQAA